MVWPARSWRVIVGRSCGVVDPYWRRPARSDDRVLSISTGASIVRDPLSRSASRIAERMLEAVDGDLLAARQHLRFRPHITGRPARSPIP